MYCLFTETLAGGRVYNGAYGPLATLCEVRTFDITAKSGSLHLAHGARIIQIVPCCLAHIFNTAHECSTLGRVVRM